MDTGSSVHGICQTRILEWVAISFSRRSFQPRDWTRVSYIAGSFFTTEPPEKPLKDNMAYYGTPLQYSCLENPTGGGAWRAAVHGVAKSWTRLSNFTFMHWRRKWQPTTVFLPGESQGRGSLVGCHLWGRTESDTTEATLQQQQQQQQQGYFSKAYIYFPVIFFLRNVCLKWVILWLLVSMQNHHKWFQNTNKYNTNFFIPIWVFLWFIYFLIGV